MDAADVAITAFPKRNASSILIFIPVSNIDLGHITPKRRCIPDVCYLRVRFNRLQFEAAYHLRSCQQYAGVLRVPIANELPIRLSKLSNSEVS